MEMFEWKKDYEIGAEVVDNAHKQLFSIVNRILRNFSDRDYEKNKTTCIEAVKYLKSYTIKHFAEEEAYMRSIDYSGYKLHKKIHDNMRDVVVPALSREVIYSCYSKESLEHFVGACAGWLTAHVMIEDQAITGKNKSRWINNADEGMDKLEEIITELFDELFFVKPTVASRNYSGHKLGELFCYRSQFRDIFGTVYTAVTAVENAMLSKLLLNTVTDEVMEMESVMHPMVSEIVKCFNEKAVTNFIDKPLTYVNGEQIGSDEFYGYFDKVYPEYSTLWRARGGFFVYFISEREDIL